MRPSGWWCYYEWICVNLVSLLNLSLVHRTWFSVVEQSSSVLVRLPTNTYKCNVIMNGFFVVVQSTRILEYLFTLWTGVLLFRWFQFKFVVLHNRIFHNIHAHDWSKILSLSQVKRPILWKFVQSCHLVLIIWNATKSCIIVSSIHKFSVRREKILKQQIQSIRELFHLLFGV